MLVPVIGKQERAGDVKIVVSVGNAGLLFDRG